MPHDHWVRWKCRLPTGPSLSVSWVGRRTGLGASLQPQEVWHLGFLVAFAGLGGSENTMFCLWHLAIVKWLLSKSFLSFETAPFLVLLLERVNFYWHFFLSASIGVSRLLVSSSPNLRIYEVKNKPVDSPLYHSWWVCSLFCTFQSLVTFVLAFSCS